MERQFTATAYIIKDEQVLLIFHKKLNKWLPPGGHLDPNETPPEGVRREVREETGLEIAFIKQENLWVKRWNACSFERPYLCLLEEIPAFGDKPAHQHIDFIYLATPAGGEELHNALEVDQMRWFTLNDVEALVGDHDIFEETKETIRAILGKKAEGGKQKAEGRKQKAESKRQKAEGRKQKAEGRKQKQKAESRRQKAEGGNKTIRKTKDPK